MGVKRVKQKWARGNVEETPPSTDDHVRAGRFRRISRELSTEMREKVHRTCIACTSCCAVYNRSDEGRPAARGVCRSREVESESTSASFFPSSPIPRAPPARPFSSPRIDYRNLHPLPSATGLNHLQQAGRLHPLFRPLAHRQANPLFPSTEL